MHQHHQNNPDRPAKPVTGHTSMSINPHLNYHSHTVLHRHHQIQISYLEHQQDNRRQHRYHSISVISPDRIVALTSCINTTKTLSHRPPSRGRHISKSIRPYLFSQLYYGLGILQGHHLNQLGHLKIRTTAPSLLLLPLSTSQPRQSALLHKN